MPLFEYRCSEGHTAEKIKASTVTSIRCNCGKIAHKIPSVCNCSFGWKLSDASLKDPNRRGADEFVRNL